MKGKAPSAMGEASVRHTCNQSTSDLKSHLYIPSNVSLEVKRQFILLYLAVFVTIKILINTILIILYLSSLRRMFSENLFFTHIKVSYHSCSIILHTFAHMNI